MEKWAMLRRLFQGKSKEQLPLTEEEYSEAANWLSEFLGQNWINEIQSGRIPFGGVIATVGEKEQQFFYVPPEGATIYNAKMGDVDLPLTVSKEFVSMKDGSKLGEAKEYLIDPRLVTNMSRVIGGILKPTT